MLYCTYEQYQTAGGTLDEAAFDTAVRPGFPAHRPDTPLAGQSLMPEACAGCADSAG